MKNKTSRYFKYAIGEIILVVIGILIALQVSNWNDNRKVAVQEQLILKRVEVELQNNIEEVNNEIIIAGNAIKKFKFCLDVLSNKKSSSISEFRNNFQPALTFVSLELSTTTFNRISQSGKIDMIKNTQLVDSLNAFYNRPYKVWDAANKDYTRNIIAPYIMQYDYVPTQDYNTNNFSLIGLTDGNFTTVNPSEYSVTPKTLTDYKNNIFIINLLHQKLLITEGQLNYYSGLSEKMKALLSSVKFEIK